METSQLSMPRKIKKIQTQPSVASAPIACDMLNEENRIQRNNEISSEDKLEALQLGQLAPSDIKEVESQRRSERICLQREQLTSQDPVTRSQARKQPYNQSTSLTFEDLEISPIKPSEHN